MTDLPFEQFPPLSAIRICRHAFTQRIPGIDVSDDKPEVLKRLSAAHREIRNEMGIADWPLVTAQQIHGNKIAVADNCSRGPVSRELADCCAVYIVDPKTPAIGLVHSGRKGTELGVVTNAITEMISRFGSEASNMIVQFSPCIRPPHYEIDFGAEIVRQCRTLGVKEIHDAGVCTACDLDRYYSYRAEKGKTGRMLALIALNPIAD